MIKSQMKTGTYYAMKVSNRIVPVLLLRIEERCEYDPKRGTRKTTLYHCRNMRTNRSVKARSALRFRYALWEEMIAKLGLPPAEKQPGVRTNKEAE